MIGALAFGFEDDVEEAAKIAGGPTLLFEPAEVFGGEIVEFATGEFAERHGPRAELFPVGGGIGGLHGERV